MNPNRLPLLMFALMGVVLCAVIGLATASWVAQAGTEADPESERLDRIAGEAVGDRPRNVETELEALKHEPSARR